MCVKSVWLVVEFLRRVLAGLRRALLRSEGSWAVKKYSDRQMNNERWRVTRCGRSQRKFVFETVIEIHARVCRDGSLRLCQNSPGSKRTESLKPIKPSANTPYRSYMDQLQLSLMIFLYLLLIDFKSDQNISHKQSRRFNMCEKWSTASNNQGMFSHCLSQNGQLYSIVLVYMHQYISIYLEIFIINMIHEITHEQLYSESLKQTVWTDSLKWIKLTNSFSAEV